MIFRRKKVDVAVVADPVPDTQKNVYVSVLEHPVVAYLNNRPPTAAEIGRAGGFSRQYAWRVMSGREAPSSRFLDACEELGVPVKFLMSEKVAA